MLLSGTVPEPPHRRGGMKPVKRNQNKASLKLRTNVAHAFMALAGLTCSGWMAG